MTYRLPGPGDIEGKTTQTAGVDVPHINLDTALAGERNVDSATDSYLAVKDDWNYTVVDLTADSTTVSTAPAIVGRVWVNTALSAHTAVFKDGATTLWTMPASTAVTTSEATAFTFLSGTRCETSLVVDPDNSMSQGSIVVQWRPL